ncbi:MAG TPA: hypothetical protein VKR53_03250 [Puia sp.]|nr:hypothetical protein [Puia sp.]
MISGAHSIIYSKDPEADKTFFKDVLHFPNVDLGHGWLIFALPPAEIAVHPANENKDSEIYLICDDIHSFTQEMSAQAIPCSPVSDQRWGLLVYLTLPGGGRLGVYEARHARP